MRYVAAYAEHPDLPKLLEKDQHLRNVRRNFPKIIEIPGGDQIIKGDRLETKDEEEVEEVGQQKLGTENGTCGEVKERLY